MSPALNGSSTLERFERSNASEIRNGIMFDFYPGLPHIIIIPVGHCQVNNLLETVMKQQLVLMDELNKKLLM